MRLRPSLLLLALSASSAGAGDAAEGRAIAGRWCAACHVVGPDQSAAADAAPAFDALARSRDDAALAGWMAAPHPPMPDPGLSRAQIDDLVAYMRSLRG